MLGGFLMIRYWRGQAPFGGGAGADHPPAEPGAFGIVSRSKRLEGVANAAPHFMGHLKVANSSPKV